MTTSIRYCLAWWWPYHGLGLLISFRSRSVSQSERHHGPISLLQNAAESHALLCGMGNSGLNGISSGESVSPLLRPLPYKRVTLSFVQCSWEELDSSLSTLPITIALLPVLDDEMITSNKISASLLFGVSRDRKSVV